MNKKIILGVMLTSAFLFVGCGGGGGGSSTPPAPSVDNSVLADGQNAYGYYGKEVIFGSSLMMGLWTLEGTYEGVERKLNITFYSDGRFYSEGAGDDGYNYYGVSLNGQVFQNAMGDYGEIKQSLGNDCYMLTQDNFNFCRTASLATVHTVDITYHYPKDVCESDSFYNIMKMSGQSNLTIASYPNDVTCATFGVSPPDCYEWDYGSAGDPACVIIWDQESVAADKEAVEDIVIDALFGEEQIAKTETPLFF